jgi:hypothetical protein
MTPTGTFSISTSAIPTTPPMTRSGTTSISITVSHTVTVSGSPIPTTPPMTRSGTVSTTYSRSLSMSPTVTQSRSGTVTSSNRTI